MVRTIEVNQPPPRTISVDQPPPRTIEVNQAPPSNDILNRIKEHPFKAAFNGATETLTGKSLEQRAQEATAPVGGQNLSNPLDYWAQVFKQAGAGTVGGVADAFTSPAGLIPIPGAKLAGKLLGKIAIKGTTLGEAVSKIPFSKLGEKDWGEVVKAQDALKVLPHEKIFNVENVDINNIPDRRKASGMSKDVFNNLSGSIQSEGIKVPVIIDKETGNILDGQHRVFIAEKLGIKDIPAIKINASEYSNKALDELSNNLNVKFGNIPIKKLMNLLDNAEILRGQKNEINTAERAKRAAAIENIPKNIQGEDRYNAKLAELKGEFPKLSHESIRGQISEQDIKSIFDEVENSKTLSLYDKVTAQTGLRKLLGAEGLEVPNNSELSLLREVFPKEFIDKVLEKRSTIEKLGSTLSDVLNIPRTVMSTADLSAPLRQGLFFIGRIKQFIPAFKDMFKYFGNEKSYEGLLDEIRLRPTYPLMRRAGLALTDVKALPNLREESFMSRLPEKIPLFGHLAKASNRAYTGFLNKLRVDVFDDLLKKMETQGVQLTDKALKDLGEFINTATGRGNIIGGLESLAPALNGVFFSPRLMASRLQLMNPQFYTKLDPFVRKEALKSLFTFSSTVATVLGLASLGGAKVGTDMRSADFGKIKVGDTRYDVMGGFQQYIRLAAQLVTGERISSTTGVKTTIGEGYKPETRLDILGNFLQTKENPIASFVTDILKGHTFNGDPVSIPKELADRFVPMIIQDMVELQQERGLEGIGMAIPGIFGVGTQTYSPTPSELVYSSKSVINYSKKLIREGKIDEGKAFYNDNIKIVEAGKQLKAFQDQISEYNRKKNFVKKRVDYSIERKRDLMFAYDEKIKELQDKMQVRADELKTQGKL